MARKNGLLRRFCSMRLAMFVTDAGGPITKRVPHSIGAKSIQDIYSSPYRKAASRLLLEAKSACYVLYFLAQLRI